MNSEFNEQFFDKAIALRGDVKVLIEAYARSGHVDEVAITEMIAPYLPTGYDHWTCIIRRPQTDHCFVFLILDEETLPAGIIIHRENAQVTFPGRHNG